MNSTWPPPLPRRSTRRSLRSPAFLPPASHLPGRSSAPPSFAGRSASTHYARRASPFVRLETAVLGRLSTSRKEPQLRQEDVDLTLPPALTLTDAGSEADTNSYRPSFASARRSMASSFASPRSTEYCCAICIELLLRPVVLSCGHRLCRGCWVRLLQGSQARAVASRTGYAVCPLGRCEVRPCVPEIDLDLEAEMRKRIGFKQLAAHAAAAEDVSLAEESAAVAAVNAWAAAGCPLDAPEEIEADEQVELAAAVAAAAAATLTVESLEREERKSLCAFLLIVFTLASACATFGLFIWGWHQKIGKYGTWLLSVLLVIVACAALLCCCCCGVFRNGSDHRMTINYGDSRSAGALTQQRRNPRAQTAPVEPQSVSESETQRLSVPESETI